MVSNTGKKLLLVVLLTYLLFAVPGYFVSVMEETFPSINLNTKKINSYINFSPMIHTVDWVADDSGTVDKAHGKSSSPLRNGTLRIFSHEQMCIILMCFAILFIFTIKKDYIFILKNNIPMKLQV